MDVKAVVLVGGRVPEGAGTPEFVCGAPVGLLDVVGAPVVHRAVSRLEQFGITDACIITENPPDPALLERGIFRPGIKWFNGTGEKFWRCAEAAFSDLAQAGAELVILVRLGAYAEIDYEELIQRHLDREARLTRATDADGRSLDTFVVSASRRNDAAYLLRHELKQFRISCHDYRFSGYINRLETAGDLRRLALDCFSRDVAFTPMGTEIKPGVWVGERVHIHKRARVLAPAFIGSHSRIRALAVITRASVVEHHSEVDCGSVVENSTVLPFSYIGPGLDLCHSVVGLRRIAHLLRHAEVEIWEPKFVGLAAASASVRAVSSAFGLATFVPRQFIRGLFSKPTPVPSSLPQAINTPAAALKRPHIEKLPAPEHGRELADLAVARRYGNE